MGRKESVLAGLLPDSAYPKVGQTEEYSAKALPRTPTLSYKFVNIVAIASEVVVLQIAILFSSGRIINDDLNLPLNKTYQEQIVAERIFANESVIGLCISTGSSILRGACYVIVGISVKDTDFFQTSSASIEILAKGYVYDNCPLKLGDSESSVSGQGNLYVATVANPGAGTPWTYTVPANARNRIKSIRYVDTVANAAVNEIVDFEPDGSHITTEAVSQKTAAVGADGVSFFPGAGTSDTTSGSLVQGALPIDSVLPAGGKVIGVSSTVANSTFTNIQLEIEEWLEL